MKTLTEINKMTLEELWVEINEQIGDDKLSTQSDYDFVECELRKILIELRSFT